MSLQPGTTFAGHRIEAVAGRGGMGVVYRATHLALDIVVALKVIAPELAADEDFRARFQRESRLAASLDHPNLVPVRHAGEEDGLLYVTMRFVEGTDLRRMIAEWGPLDPGLAGELAGQIAGGLGAAHEAGLVHRDVKPANILVEERNGGFQAYLTDFGLTRRTTGSDALTRTGRWMGTIDYVAPEQIQGGEVDGRADVYSLGCVLFQALTGEVPFPRDTEVAKMYAHLHEEAPSVRELRPELPVAIDPVLRHATAIDPAGRYSAAPQLGRDAREVLGMPREGATAAPAAVAPLPPTIEAAGPAPGGPVDPTTPGGPSDGDGGEEPGATRPDMTQALPPEAKRWRSLVGAALAATGAVVAVLVGVAVFGGGGDGDGGSATAGGGGSQSGAARELAAFRADADAICTGIERQVEEASAAGEPQTEFLTTRAEIVKDGVARLRRMDVPPGQAESFRAYAVAREAFADRLLELRDALESGDTAAQARAQERIERTVERKMRLGEQLGMAACADVLPSRDRRQVVALSRNWILGRDTQRICAGGVTRTFLDERFGGSTERCVAEQEASPLAAEATLDDLFGVENVHATAVFSTDTGEVLVDTDFEDGTWKVDGSRVRG